MSIYFGGNEYAKAYVAGAEISGINVAGASVHAPDRPGTLSVQAQRSGSATMFTISVTDPDGIRSITSATATARDGQTGDFLGDLSRADANTFSGTDRRANARWRRGSLTVVYVDAKSGESRTLTTTWRV